jgi:pimeloyl-ACP methyl ester carboxylesterase
MITTTALLFSLVQVSPSPLPSPSPAGSPSPVGSPRAPLAGDFVGADGVRLSHRRVGTGAKVVVFLAPGGGLAHPAAARIETLAGPGRSVVFYDPRGTGLSDPVTDPDLLTADHHVRDLEALRLHLGVQRMTLVALKEGAALAAQYAADNPTHVERLVLVSPIPIEESEEPAAVERLGAPVLVIDGLRSNATLTASREWAAFLPNARLLLVRGAGNDVLADQPAAFTTAMRQFLAGRHPAGSEVVPGPDAH